MGKMHFKNYRQIEGVEVAAICDIVKEKLTDKPQKAGNIEGADKKFDLAGCAIFTDVEKMFDEASLDAVSITLPTYLHKEYTIKAIRAGLHVLCEKPMALNSSDSQEMIDVAQQYEKVLQIGHCIRFWPEYMKVKKIIDSGQYGNVKAAIFHRLSLSPTWVWDNWLLDAKRSGGALLDLHIHDADFIQYLWGIPDSVVTRAIKGYSGGYDHVVTQYLYKDEKVITAEGGWMMTNSFGFRMSFEITLEKAVICYDSKKSPTLTIYPESCEAFTPEIENGTGYLYQMKHFVKSISGHSVPEIITPRQSLLSIKLIELEKKSAETKAIIQIS